MNNNDNQQNGGFVVHVYSPGNQIIQTQNNNYYGPVYQGKSETGNNSFTDDQIKKALLACIGEERVICNMRRWAGAYWCLRWKCNYPVDIREFCTKIKSLELDIAKDYDCDYQNIRRFCKLSFIEYDPFGKTEVKVSAMDREVYSWCREVANKLAEELGKTYLPKK